MTQANQMELAKQGNPQAIAALMNRSLQPKGITATAERQGNILNITLELANAVDPKTLVAFVEKGMTNLGVQTISKVRVFGQQPGASTPSWQQEILLAPEEEEEEEEYFFPTDDGVEEDNFMDDEYLEPNDLSPDYPEDIEDAESGDYYEEDIEEDINEDLDHSAEVTPTKGKKNKLPLIIGGVILGLALLGGLLYFLLPTITGTLLSGNTEPNTSPSPTTAPTTPANTATTAPSAPATATTAPAPAANPPVNYWYQGVKKAQSAATLAQTAQSQAEWNQVANEWQAASNFMKQVPQSNPNYPTAQQKAVEYQRNVDIAKQRAANSYY